MYVVDTVILAAAALRWDVRHKDASAVISAIVKGKAGKEDGQATIGSAKLATGN